MTAQVHTLSTYFDSSTSGPQKENIAAWGSKEALSGAGEEIEAAVEVVISAFGDSSEISETGVSMGWDHVKQKSTQQQLPIYIIPAS